MCVIFISLILQDIEKPVHGKSSESNKWNETADVVDEKAGNFSNFRISERTQSKLTGDNLRPRLQEFCLFAKLLNYYY